MNVLPPGYTQVARLRGFVPPHATPKTDTERKYVEYAEESYNKTCGGKKDMFIKISQIIIFFPIMNV